MALKWNPEKGAFEDVQPQASSNGAPRPADLSGAPSQIYQPGGAQKGPDRSAYDPYANDETRTRSNMSGGFGSAGEMLGTASKYRSPGYDINNGAGYVGGNQGYSQAQQDAYGRQADASRNAGVGYGMQYASGIQYGDQSRGLQQNAAQMYLDQLNGNRASMAQQQLAQGLQNAQAQQASIAAGARGGGANLAAAQLAGAQMAGQQGAGYNQQAAMLRAQEDAAAMQGLAGIGTQMRAQDYGLAGIGLQGQGLAMNDALAYEKLRQNQQLGELSSQTQLEATQGQLALDRQKQLAQEEQKSAEEGSSLFGGTIGAFGSLFKGLSDERTKTDKRDASTDIDARLDKLRGMAYRYKDEPKGTERIGIMAQDMPEETVEEVGGAKVIRMPEAAGFGLAAIARLNDRVRKLEGKK